MRKYVIGFACGLVFASASVVYASDAIKATLFPVKYEVNGLKSEPEEGYYTLNYEGRAYVPIRYVAESLDAVVIYDDALKTIRIDNAFNLTSIASEIKAGHLNVVKNGNISKITGKLYAGQDYWDSLYTSKMMVMPGSKVDVKAYVAFYDDSSRIITKVPITVSCIAKGDQLKEFEVTTEHDISGYSFATLEYVLPESIDAFLPPNLNVIDKTGVLAVEQTDMKKDGDYTKIRIKFGVQKKGLYRVGAILTYYDKLGKVLGTAELKSIGEGSVGAQPGEQLNIYQYETAGKGDFTKASKFTLTLNVLEPVSSKESEAYSAY